MNEWTRGSLSPYWRRGGDRFCLKMDCKMDCTENRTQRKRTRRWLKVNEWMNEWMNEGSLSLLEERRWQLLPEDGLQDAAPRTGPRGRGQGDDWRLMNEWRWMNEWMNEWTREVCPYWRRGGDRFCLKMDCKMLHREPDPENPKFIKAHKSS